MIGSLVTRILRPCICLDSELKEKKEVEVNAQSVSEKTDDQTQEREEKRAVKVAVKRNGRSCGIQKEEEKRKARALM